ncbi:MAG: acyl-CoA thioesterase [Bdellovibrionales bacterium]
MENFDESKIIFSSEDQLHFDQADSAGILYFPKAFEIFHRAWEQHLSDQKVYSDYFQSDKFAFPIVSANCDFKKPLILGQKFKSEIIVIGTGTSSFTLGMRVSKDASPICFVKVVIVSISKHSKVAAPLPNFLPI